MPTELYLPDGYYLATVRFSGSAVPLGAAITWVGSHGTSADPAGVGTTIKTLLQKAPAAGVQAGPFNSGGPMSSNLTVLDITTKFGPLASGASAVTSVAAAAGSGGGDSYSPSCGLLVAKVTNSGGRRGRGRMFIPGLTESMVTTGGLIASSSQSDVQASWTQFLGDLANNQIGMCVGHRYPVGATGQANPTPVTFLRVASKIGTQRRRLR